MRKVFVPAAAAAAMLLAVLPMTAASAAPKSDVLTITKVGGANVKVGAVLTASLKKGTTANFFKPHTTTGVKCKSVSFTDKVTSNPTHPGTAKELLTKQTFNKCSSNVGGVKSVKSVTLNKLPYKTTISDSKGNPVTVYATSTTIKLNSILGTLTCIYTAKTTKGVASNTGQTITFTNQLFTLKSGSSGCFPKGSFSATFGPVKDSSAGNAAVYIN